MQILIFRFTRHADSSQHLAIADRIVDRFHPEKILLFGSYARGKAHHSALDLLLTTKSNLPEAQFAKAEADLQTAKI